MLCESRAVAQEIGGSAGGSIAGRRLGSTPSSSGQTGAGLDDPDGPLRLRGTPARPGATPTTAGGSSNGATRPTTGTVPRPGLRENRARRSRSPVAAPVQGGFRSTLAPTGIAANVQPVQTGLPDPTLPPITALRRRLPVDDPYAPLGVRAGNVILLPVVGQSLGYDTNPNRTQTNRRSSVVSQTEGELAVQSDWSRHELSGLLRGAYNEYLSNEAANRPEGAGRLGLRLDATRDTQVDVEGHFLIDTQRPGSPDLNAVVRERPVVYTEGASVGVTQRFNRLVGSLRGTIDRADYDDARLANGTVLDQRDRALTSYGVRGRLGYELTPGLLPFVEAFGDTRVYDRRIDSAGFARSSDGFGAKLGTTFEVTRLLTGEVSAGAVNRTYEDRRLGNLTSPVADLALAYAATPLTTVRATASAAVDETTIAGANGIRSLRGALTVSHDLRRNLTLTAGVTAADYEYQGVSITERSFGALARADYRLNRNVALRASYNYDNLRSTVAGSSYVANVFLLGVRLTP